MNEIAAALEAGRPVNLSRRAALGALAAGFSLAIGVPVREARAQAAGGLQHARKVASYITIHPTGRITLLNPFAEGGQGIHTAVAQIVAEELDAELTSFDVEVAPPGADYQVLFNGTARVTGGSFSIRNSYQHFRVLGATARAMLVAAGAQRLGVPAGECATVPGFVVHAASNRRIPYGELAQAAAALPVPQDAQPKTGPFRLIGTPAKRLDSRDKATGRAQYGIDVKVEDMLQAAVVHAPRAGADPAEVVNEAALRAMPGVHSVHRLPGAVAVVADSFWRAKQAVAKAEVMWSAAAGQTVIAEDYSTASHLELLKSRADAEGNPARDAQGDAPAALRAAPRVVTADYDAPMLAHAQLEPPTATVRINADGTMDVWTPNQAPERFQQIAAREAGMEPDKVRIHSPLMGGFFGRHFTYGSIHPMNQAVRLARATGRPVKVVWTREEEFARDAYRPLAFARLRAGLDASGKIVALHATVPGEGPVAQHSPPARLGNPPVDTSAVEGVAFKPYDIPNRRVDWVRVPSPVNIGFWRSVGHSMNDFFYECFLDEVAEAAGQDPFAFRMAHLGNSARLRNLLNAVADLSGGWRRGPFDAADGSRRARGIAMASPFGSEVATIAEVSIRDAEVAVHDVWVAIDPGSIVNPAIIAAQVESAVAIGLSSAAFEEITFENGRPVQRNFDSYRILSPREMPKVHVRIVESGAPMGGIGEPGTPGVPPAVANAVAALTGRRIRSLPFNKERWGQA
ncbi:xanthine dehydrogenase family protein molybdopterin-binding subunit [Falsiroseomonas oryziterrae]|uniref:xanthine dehydrogenase family protein molybdopterin-binding subunit n=1 Tax=Falsiroseomonas oryziterrae TaxID=2911368 RepID=UPI001F1AFB89|nr:molybdopterin cofactor-binding domain-containing protein [Roseomonas sp. NPKOSM-4]